MQYFRLLFAALAIASGVAQADTSVGVKGDRLTLSVDARTQANLIYQLDCMAELIRCAPDVFQRLWHGELQFDAADQEQLEAWRRLRESFGQRDKPGASDPEISTPFPLVSSDDPTLWADVQEADYGGGDVAAIDAAQGKFLPAAEVATLHQILEHFRPRFERWWSANSDTVTTFVPALQDALKEAHGFELIAAATRFYGADLGDGRLQIHLVALPKGPLKQTSAIRVGPHLIVEVIAGEKPEARVDVVVHELAHYVFASIPFKAKAAFMEHMLAAGDGAIPSWSLFDEIQATVIGNVIAYRNVATPEMFRKKWEQQTFYASEPIDLGARATHQLFDTAFALGGPMRSDFPSKFVEAMRAGLGSKLETGAAYLNTMASINLDPRDKNRKRQMRRTLHTTAAWEYDAEDGERFIAHAKQYPDMSVAVLLRDAQLSQVDGLHDVLAASTPQVQEALGGSEGIIFVARRSGRAYAFVLVARSDAAIDALIAALPRCPLTPGVCKRI